MGYPLLINGKSCGELSMEQDGLYTLVRAEAESEADMVRLWLHGMGESAYLGIMQKGERGMNFSRRYTRRETAAFPQRIEFASDRAREGAVIRTPAPEKARSDAPAPRWGRNADGSLTATENGLTLVALPSSIGRRIYGADIRIIEGREYIVFKY